MEPKPHPREDVAVTRDSAIWLTKNGLGTPDSSTSGTESYSGTLNEL